MSRNYDLAQCRELLFAVILQHMKDLMEKKEDSSAYSYAMTYFLGEEYVTHSNLLNLGITGEEIVRKTLDLRSTPCKLKIKKIMEKDVSNILPRTIRG